jgi:hypothetical protein
MPVPKTTVDKYDLGQSGHYDVGRPRQIPSMESVPAAKGVKQFADD